MKKTVISLVVLLLTLIACQSPVSLTHQNTSGHSLTLSWGVGGRNARTILPTGIAALDNYTVTLHPSSGSDVVQSSLTGSSYTFNSLPAANYTVTVDGYTGINKVATGQVTGVNLSSASSANAPVALAYIATYTGTENGSISLSFTNSGPNISSASFTLLDPSGSTVSGLAYTTGFAATTALLTYNNAPVGNYTLVAQFTAGSKIAIVTESILVLQNITTNNAGTPIALVSSDFNSNTAMVLVPGGTFQRDGTASNTTTVSSFLMGKYDVTQAQFLAVSGFAPSFLAGNPSNPVEQVTWFDAVNYCNQLSAQEGLSAVYSLSGIGMSGSHITSATVTADLTKTGYRLPTEMEWMWAAMGGTSDSRVPSDFSAGINITGYNKGYSGSGEGAGLQASVDTYAWTSSNATTSKPVGTRASNELGLFDLCGNVWQWCEDLGGTYPSGQRFNNTTVPTGTDRSFRGGSFYSGASAASLSYRTSTPPSSYSNTTGFRVVRSLVPLYTVTYNTNGATSGTAPYDPQAYPVGTSATALANTGSLQKSDGSYFVGWNTATNGSGTSYAPSSTVPIGSGNVTLYANWVLPTMTTISPTSGPIGTVITITGTGFSTTLTNNFVGFASSGATFPNTVTPTQITFTVGQGTLTGQVLVSVNNGNYFYGPTFTVTGPTEPVSFPSTVGEITTIYSSPGSPTLNSSPLLSGATSGSGNTTLLLAYDATLVSGVTPSYHHTNSNSGVNGGIQYVYSGLNTIPFTSPIPSGEWARISVLSGYLTGSATLAGFQLQLDGTTWMTVQNAIAGGYVSPFCLIYTWNIAPTWSWTSFYDGSSSGNGNYTNADVWVKTLPGHTITAAQFTSSAAFDQTYDGFAAVSYPGMVLSLGPL